jgi:hypothetical protein
MFELIYPAKLVSRPALARFTSKLHLEAMRDPNVHFHKATLPDGKIAGWAKWIIYEDGKEEAPVAQPPSFYPTGTNSVLWHSFLQGAYDATQRIMEGRPYASRSSRSLLTALNLPAGQRSRFSSPTSLTSCRASPARC